MKEGHKAMEQLNKEMDIDDINELYDDLADQEPEMEERRVVFENVADENREALIDELDELERLAKEDEMDVVIPTGVINVPEQVSAEEEKERDGQRLLDLMEQPN